LNWFVRTGYRFIRFFVKSFMRFSLDFEIWGKENLLPDGAKIYCSNHFSSTDPFYVITFMEDPIHMVIGPGFSVPVIKLFLKWGKQINALPEYRHLVIKKAVEFLDKNEPVYIFPEGELNDQIDFLKFYSGIGRIYLEHPCPIIPIGILSPRKNVIEQKGGIKEGETVHTTRTVLRGKYCANIGKPLLFPEYEKMEDKMKAAELITEKLKTAIENLIQDIKVNKFWS
jgi:1-acyl-sn-glycerol-3-phosphate acyltransferase